MLDWRHQPVFHESMDVKMIGFAFIGVYALIEASYIGKKVWRSVTPKSFVPLPEKFLAAKSEADYFSAKR
jgi:hypothetical protein